MEDKSVEKDEALHKPCVQYTVYQLKQSMHINMKGLRAHLPSQLSSADSDHANCSKRASKGNPLPKCRVEKVEGYHGEQRVSSTKRVPILLSSHSNGISATLSWAALEMNM